VHPLSPLLRGGIVVVAMLVAAGRQLLEGGTLGWPLAGVGAVVVAVVAWGGLSWWVMRFRLGTQTLLIESGILVRRSRRIRLDRLQAVEVQQPFLARLFGMAELAIETAGSGTEATLAYLRLDHARRLRAELLERAAAAASPSGPEEAFAPGSGPVTATDGAGGERRSGQTPVDRPGARLVAPEPPPELLHQVPPGRLLLSQLVRTAPLVMLVLGVVGVTVMLALDEPMGITVLVPAAIAMASVVGNGFVGQYNFRLSRTSQRLGVRAGLFDVRSQSIPVGRVQGVVVHEPLVWRWLGWCEVKVTVAGVEHGSDDSSRLTTTLLPVIDRAAGFRLTDSVLGGSGLAGAPLQPGPRTARWLDPLGWRIQAMGLGADLLVTRRGVLELRTDVAPRHKVQSVGVRQGPVQRRLGLATLHVHLPAGPVDPEGRHRQAGELWALALSASAAVTPDGAAAGDAS
jgi:putative membrane protein